MIPSAVYDSTQTGFHMPDEKENGETFKVDVGKVLGCKCFCRLTSILVFFYMKIMDQDM